MHSHDSHRHHEGHSHAHSAAEILDGSTTGPDANSRRERRLLFAFGLTTIMMVVEAVGGLVSGSLALLADAGHMLVDAGALMFAWLGAHFARRPADKLRSFGYGRLEVLVGYTNALTQMLLVAWIAFEAVSRFLDPAPILSGTMLVVAIAGLMVNLFVLRVLGGHDHDDLNTAAARLHVIGDLLGSLGAVAAALVVRYLDWLWADPAISIVVSLLILASAWRLLRRSAHILLEGVPEGVDAGVVASHLESQVDGVREIHHVHVWQLSGGHRVATLHARLHEGIEPDKAIQSIQGALKARFGVTHATVQIEAEEWCEAACGGAPDAPRI
ncbi:MAG TPA: cation diffusion facilitator family transporter [Dokdonella sp.]|jgi:cobalt-zinc-cadmium efflux system protein|nr:cation diffusion facilitator family transporter [Dokdonella sp.]